MRVEPGTHYWDGKTSLPFRYDDAGRSASGFAPPRDSAARAIAIASGRPYEKVMADLFAGQRENSRKTNFSTHASPSGTGIYRSHKWLRDYMTSLGATWTPGHGLGHCCTVRLLQGELPSGRLVVALSGQYTAVIDGTIHDTVDPTRVRVRIADLEQRLVHRCVRGYWTCPPLPAADAERTRSMLPHPRNSESKDCSLRATAPAVPIRWHDLKTDALVWDDAAAGRKRYEIRRDDRGYQLGDGLRLRKTLHSAMEMRAGAPLIYTEDQPLEVVVTHILRGAIYGVSDGFAILSFQPLAARTTSSAPAAAAIREAFLDFFADIEWDTDPPAHARVSGASVEELAKAVGFRSSSAVNAAGDQRRRRAASEGEDSHA